MYLFNNRKNIIYLVFYVYRICNKPVCLARKIAFKQCTCNFTVELHGHLSCRFIEIHMAWGDENQPVDLVL